MAVLLIFSGLAPALGSALVLWGTGQDFTVIAGAYILSGSLGLLAGAGLMQIRPPDPDP